MDKLTWKNIKINLGGLTPWEKNPKRIGKAQAKRLLESFEEFGQPETIAVGPAGEVYDGHQRLSVLLAAYGPSYEIDARQSNRPLTDQERRKLIVLLHSGTVGTWNWDELAGWDEGELAAWGLDAGALAQWNDDAANLSTMLAAASPVPQRPDFEHIVDQFSSEKGNADKDEKWFYVEFYGDAARYDELVEALADHMPSRHQLSADFFYNLVLGEADDEV